MSERPAKRLLFLDFVEAMWSLLVVAPLRKNSTRLRYKLATALHRLSSMPSIYLWKRGERLFVMLELWIPQLCCTTPAVLWLFVLTNNVPCMLPVGLQNATHPKTRATVRRNQVSVGIRSGDLISNIHVPLFFRSQNIGNERPREPTVRD